MKFWWTSVLSKRPKHTVVVLHDLVRGRWQSGSARIPGSEFQRKSKRVSNQGENGSGNGFGREGRLRRGGKGEEFVAPHHLLTESLQQKDKNLRVAVNPSGTIICVLSRHGAKWQVTCAINANTDDIGPLQEGGWHAVPVHPRYLRRHTELVQIKWLLMVKTT